MNTSAEVEIDRDMGGDINIHGSNTYICRNGNRYLCYIILYYIG